MRYHLEIIAPDGRPLIIPHRFTRDEWLAYIRATFPRAKNFGDGFWSKSDVYLGRIVAVGESEK